ncbi:uncharacterized protein METZ01_LOCUS201939, partial [marine metagenome]
MYGAERLALEQRLSLRSEDRGTGAAA